MATLKSFVFCRSGKAADSPARPNIELSCPACGRPSSLSIAKGCGRWSESPKIHGNGKPRPVIDNFSSYAVAFIRECSPGKQGPYFLSL
jgi:hypothetical protein